MKKNITFILIIVISLLLGAYGFYLKANGYREPMEGAREGRYVALGLMSLREGVFPWNADEQDGMVYAEGVILPPTEGTLAKENGTVVTVTAGGPATEPTPAAEEAPEEREEGSVSENGAADPESEGDGLTEEGAVSENEAESVSENEASWPPPFVTADESYFDDAVFIGDSRMVGVAYFSGITNGHFLAKTSMNIFWMMNTAPETDTTVSSVREGLMRQQYGKVYILTGINEVGSGDPQYFTDAYRKVLAEIRELQPDAIIYIHAVTHVSAAVSAGNPVFDNGRIDERNEALKQMAEEEKVIFIDINEAFDDENGCLPAENSWDGIHPSANLYPLWKEYLLTHTVELE